MNTEKREKLSLDIATHLQQVGALREQAEHFALQQTQKMFESGEAYELSDDEERLLKAYRAFISRSRPGATFKWRSPITSNELVLPAEPSLLHEPREVT